MEDFWFLESEEAFDKAIFGEKSGIELPSYVNKKPIDSQMNTQNNITEMLEEEEKFNNLQMPPTFHPKQFLNSVCKKEDKLRQFAKGTTTLAFKFQGGIIVAVDARASMGTFIGSNTVRKILEINSDLLGTMAGGAADCQYWEKYLARVCRMYELLNNEKLTVASASKILADMVGRYKGYGLSMGTMIAGSDLTGQHLYYVDDSGMRIKGDLFSVGSGSPYAYGVLDTGYKESMSLEEAIELGMRAIVSATYRDSASGGVVRVYHVHDKGWTIIHDAIDVCQKFHQLYPTFYKPK